MRRIVVGTLTTPSPGLAQVDPLGLDLLDAGPLLLPSVSATQAGEDHLQMDQEHDGWRLQATGQLPHPHVLYGQPDRALVSAGDDPAEKVYYGTVGPVNQVDGDFVDTALFNRLPDEISLGRSKKGTIPEIFSSMTKSWAFVSTEDCWEDRLWSQVETRL